MRFVKTVWATLKTWNRRRIEVRRIQRVLVDDIPKRRDLAKPSQCGGRTILLIDSMYGLGDALFVNGLIHRLTALGERVLLITLNRTMGVYQSNRDIEKIFVLGSDEDLALLKKEKIDLAVDLGYVGLDRWELRKPLLKGLDTYVFTCSRLARCANMVNEYIDVSREHHISARMLLILEAINAGTARAPVVRPFYALPEESGDEKSNGVKDRIYVNCVGGEADRCFSKEQIKALARWFENQDRFEGVFFSGNKGVLSESKHVSIQPLATFEEFARTLSRCRAVISPDTMPVHMASAFNLPCLAFYCGGEQDYFKKCAMVETWRPMGAGSKCVLSIVPDVKESTAVTPLSKITPQNLVNEVKAFLAGLP